MDNDDQQVGYVLARRDALILLGTAGAALLAGCAPAITGQPAGTPVQGSASSPTQALSTATQTIAGATTSTLPTCVVRPALTEGPYFVDEMLNRSDIRSDPSDGSVREGAPLRLKINVSQLDAAVCAPLANAIVDIWHCDALGVYSDVSDPSFNTNGKKFLRGYQVTDENGAVEFLTIYPGWYSGRTVHIHFKIRSDSGYDFTSQFFFDDALSDQVFTNPPYASKGQRNVLNSSDGIYQGSGGQLTLQPVQNGDGYAARFDIGLDLS